MCRLRNIAMRDYQESVTIGQTHRRTDRHTHTQTDAGQSDPYVPLCFAGDTKIQYKDMFLKYLWIYFENILINEYKSVMNLSKHDIPAYVLGRTHGRLTSLVSNVKWKLLVVACVPCE